MDVRTQGLSATFEFTPPNGEGWLACSVIVDVPGFHGDYDIQLLLSDLEAFRAQLAHADNPANWPCQARFVSTDPGIDLVLRVQRTGQVSGEYEFQNENGGARLSGTMKLDQTYLRPMLSQVERALLQLACARD